MSLDALCGNDLATVFIIPKIKSYLICESQVALFVLLLFVRVLFQFFYQQITEALRWDNLVPVACGIELRVAVTPTVVVLFADLPRFQLGRLFAPGAEHLMEPGCILALEHIHPKMNFSIALTNFQAITVLKGKAGRCEHDL